MVSRTVVAQPPAFGSRLEVSSSLSPVSSASWRRWPGVREIPGTVLGGGGSAQAVQHGVHVLRGFRGQAGGEQPGAVGEAVQIHAAVPGGPLVVPQGPVLIQCGGDAGGVAGQGVRVMGAGEVQQHRLDRRMGFLQHTVRQPIHGAGDDVGRPGRHLPGSERRCGVRMRRRHHLPGQHVPRQDRGRQPHLHRRLAGAQVQKSAAAAAPRSCSRACAPTPAGSPGRPARPAAPRPRAAPAPAPASRPAPARRSATPDPARRIRSHVR